jgi:hypothetical protein
MASDNREPTPSSPARAGENEMKTTYRTQAEEREIATLTNRIKEIEATERRGIGTDQGTHSDPTHYDIWEEISGERYATVQHANANATRCTVEEAEADTHGRIRMSKDAQAEMKELRVELAAAKKALAKLTD